MLKTLQRIIQQVQSGTDVSESMHRVVCSVKEYFHANACSLYFSDDERGEYVLFAATGLPAEVVGKLRLKFSEGLVGLVAEREEPINVADQHLEPSHRKFSYFDESSLHGFLGAPIINQGKLLGVLVVQQQIEATFSEDAEAFVVTLCAQLATELAQIAVSGSLLTTTRRKRKKRESILTGIPSASGIGMGKAVVVFPLADLEAVPDREAENIELEIEKLEQALQASRDEMRVLHDRAKHSLSITEQALFEAYSRILDSRTLIGEIEAEIRGGQWVQSALRRVIKRHILHFESLEDAYLRERASDFKDLGRRILSYLQNNKPQAIDYPKQTILISEEVTPAALIEVPEGCLAGVISSTGSGNSHVAILARALGAPTVMGVAGLPLVEMEKQDVIVDGYSGQVYLYPSPAVKKEIRELIQEEQELDVELEAIQNESAITTDKKKISLFVNTGLVSDVSVALNVGAEGVGLYRTEMPFLLRDRFPSEEEQRVLYRQLLATFAPRPVVMRTLDIGGDKALPYFSIKEDNPFLGWRGIRISLDHPEIFLQQVRAMLQASSGFNNLRIMLPMITNVNEVESALHLIRQAYEEVHAEDEAVVFPQLGLMIEVPSAVYQAYDLALRVDFLSVGSNDLIQYLLAVDRNNPRVAELYNALHPAVLQALQHVAVAGRRARVPVSICGEMASDPMAIVLLMAMGYKILSISPRALPRSKWVVRRFSMAEAKKLLHEVLKMDDPVEVRVHMEMALDNAGLGGLIRAGR
ncbi:MAG: phosphoenolpyruvate--protein phosphotransferase [Gammaproteobacteria bacterium RIFCSPHIGHO2_12_FULL_41_15]|nr:MAG: phosphoenolpyruvate--protein phosphotransferase [Gammaproteobacteria bacterium RIFCSPHIGHO2_12_FULL_41_15]